MWRRRRKTTTTGSLQRVESWCYGVDDDDGDDDDIDSDSNGDSDHSSTDLDEHRRGCTCVLLGFAVI